MRPVKGNPFKKQNKKSTCKTPKQTLPESTQDNVNLILIIFRSGVKGNKYEGHRDVRSVKKFPFDDGKIKDTKILLTNLQHRENQFFPVVVVWD